jgi:hypothetical protein
MNDQNQDDIDALLGGMDEKASDGENPVDQESSGDDSYPSVVAEDTGDSPDVQAEELLGGGIEGASGRTFQQKEPVGVPWVDYLPEDVRPKPTNLLERLDRAIENADAELVERESLIKKWALQEKRVDGAYYKHWILNGNAYFRNLVIFKIRRARIAASQAQEAENSKPLTSENDKAS